MKKYLLLPLLAGILLYGCRPGATSKSIELLDEFIIMGFFGPPVEELNAERFREVAGSGIEVLVQGNGIYDGPGNLRVMDLAEEAGIRILPFDARILELSSDPDATVDLSVVKAVQDDYRDPPDQRRLQGGGPGP